MSRTQKGKFQLLRFNLAVAVGKQEWVISTAVIWLWQSRIQKWFLLLPFLSAFQLNLQSPELVLSDTTVIKLWKTNRNCSSTKAFSFCYCRFREIISLNGSMANTFWFLYGHFCYLGSRIVKKQDVNCRLKSSPTVKERKILFPTVGATVELSKSRMWTVD